MDKAPEIARQFGKECEKILLEALEPEQDRVGTLRLSSIGKPDRQLWNAYNGVDAEKITGPTYIKFLYGHLIEAMVLALVRLAGHKVTDEQKEVKVAGVKGHMDCKIDGILVDVKSCSSYSFKKFKNNELHLDDPFGYIGQIKAYAKAEGEMQYGWLAFDKQNGTLCTLMYDESDANTSYFPAIDYDIEERIREVKKLVSGVQPPHCYDPMPDGKSGNERLRPGCAYCPFKHACWPGLQTYVYANGPKYLTKVDKEPRVVKIPEGF